MTWYNWVLLAYLLVLVGVAIIGRSLLQWRRTGINPVWLPRDEGMAGLAAWAFKVVVVALASAALFYLLVPDAAVMLGAIPWLMWSPVQSVGALFLLLSAGIVLTAQAQMGNSFRIGIDTEHETPLVQRGLYKWSRNPIFLGMRLGLLGVFLVMPNAVSLACWLVGDLAIQMQVYLEEEFLAKRHGKAYQRFTATAPRWLKVM